MKRTICFLVICVFMLLGLSSCDSEVDALIKDAEARVSITNILSNYELLLAHGYIVTLNANDPVHLQKSGLTEDGGYTHRIKLNRGYLNIPDADFQFTITAQTQRMTIRYSFFDTSFVYTHRLRIESEAVVIHLLEDTSNRYSRAIFDELNLILDVVNLE